uniref:Retrotransposon Copia-like N-terminal domain-containing protein n=1 Tax=Manihot esculenta TaxID=3983 RepID=A0A2C9VMX6_MANES
MAIQQTIVNQINDHFQNPSNPYFLHHNVNSSLVLVSPVLDEKNYHSWACSMKMACLSKNKVRFIDGTLPMPTVTDSMRSA